MVSALCWSPASITFYPNERCSSLEPIADVPFMHLLRKSIWRPGLTINLLSANSSHTDSKSTRRTHLAGATQGNQSPTQCARKRNYSCRRTKVTFRALDSLGRISPNDSDALEKVFFSCSIWVSSICRVRLSQISMYPDLSSNKDQKRHRESRRTASGTKEAIVALENDRPRNAIKLLEPFVQTETPSVDALAYIAVAMIQSTVVGLHERRMNLQHAHCAWAISIPSLMRL